MASMDPMVFLIGGFFTVPIMKSCLIGVESLAHHFECLVVVVYQNCLTSLCQCCDAGCAASGEIIKNDISRIGVNANYAIDDPKRFLRWIASFFSSVGTDNRVPPRIRWCFTF